MAHALRRARLRPLRHDDARSDLARADGAASGTFSTIPSVRWLLAAGASVKLRADLDLSLRIEWRIRYYDSRAGQPLADDLMASIPPSASPGAPAVADGARGRRVVALPDSSGGTSGGTGAGNEERPAAFARGIRDSPPRPSAWESGS